MCELEEAYNEWLLLFGYRPQTPRGELYKMLVSKLHTSENQMIPTLIRETQNNGEHSYYTLKPLSEVQHLFKKEAI